MAPHRWSKLFLAAQIACLAAPARAQSEPAQTPGSLVFQGGSDNDQAFARAAAGLTAGAPLGEEAFQAALEAIRLTDRFSRVEGERVAGPDGVAARVRLEPWPAIARLAWRGDARQPVVRKLIRGLRPGMRPGELRLADWSRDLKVRLAEAGYREARVAWAREAGATLAVTVTLGPGDLLRRLELEGDPAPYSAQEITGFTGLAPGRTLWTAAVQQQTLRNLRKVFRRHQRYEARIEMAWDAGTLRLTVVPGPRVVLALEGDGLGWGTQLKDLVPLPRADRYSPELLDEGDRRLIHFFRGKGYLDAQVGHRREVTASGQGGYQEVTVTYTVHRGPRTHLDGLRFEGNVVFSEAQLRAAAALPSGLLSLGRPKVTPELLDALEARLKTLYLSRGYTEVSLRRQLEPRDGRNELVFRIREGPQRLVRWLRLELPAGGFGDPWRLGECLPLVFSDGPAVQAPAPPGQGRAYPSDRRNLAGLQGVLTRTGDGPDQPVVLTLALNRPIPLLKGDLTRVYSAIRQQRLPALGVVRPQVRLSLEQDGEGVGVRIEVPAQPQETIRRLVVSGSDRTQARAVLRETNLLPGAPLDTDLLSRSQARLSYLGAFQRVDLTGLAELEAAPAGEPGPDLAPEPGPGGPEDQAPTAAEPAPEPAPAPAGRWKPGDLKLTLEERPPWVVTNSFGYNKSQGYHVGLGVQQLNLGGMGRSMDYGIRAGDGTIHNPTLARIFPTGAYDRSVDSFTVGYTDPWFAPEALKGWLADRTQYRVEAAYIQERQSLYLLHRRRVLNSLQWTPGPRVSFTLGYRWERVDVSPAIPGVSSEELSVLARFPAQAIISAPFAQVARDSRDNALDPTSGMYSAARVEFANQLFLTSATNSFVKVDLRNQWTWPVGYKARAGVVALGLRLGVAKPTASSAENLPLSERFFAGGPFSFRGVEPDTLGAQTLVPLRFLTGPNAGQQETDANGAPIFYATPTGGQGLALVNLEYRFPLLRQSLWGELFVDSGQVYQSLKRLPAQGDAPPVTAFPPFRTALGLGLIFKIGIPLKIEYAADVKRILGLSRSQSDRDTQLKSLLISMGFQF